MDEILLILMHTLRGLKIGESDVVALLKGDPGPALARLKGKPGWREESLAWLEQSAARGVRWSRLGDDLYPRGWLHLSERPLVFSFLGEPCWKNTPLFAVVGSRTPMSDSRMWMQRELGLFLRASGAGVVSGGARGVDQWAHRISMDEGRPTLCVLPSGILNPYPPGSHDFWDAVLAGGGALLSAFPPSEPMRKHHFHTRNRWIVGFSPAVFVVEANRRSGSAMTGALAREEGREVCTLPVFPHSEQGLANLDLLDLGATMIRDHRDLNVMWGRQRSSPAFFERLHREGEEDGIDQPQS